MDGLDRFLVGSADESLSDARSAVQAVNADLPRIQGFADAGVSLGAPAPPTAQATEPELAFIPLSPGGQVLPLRRSQPPAEGNG
jgi:hypothetical protein